MKKNKDLQEKLFRKKETAWPKTRKEIFSFSEKYSEFLARSKTERMAVRSIIAALKKDGFSDIDAAKVLKPGSKVYLNHKDKSVIAAIIGKNPEKLRLIGSHIDSPRLDLKPNPVFEASSIALLKTHYYGGIKKYQWTNVDLALYGIIHTKAGKKIEFTIGEDEKEPRFIVPDLLPHLARKQLEKLGKEIVEGEQLNVFIGNIPVDDKDISEKVKFSILKYLNDTYGLVEEDFSFAELNFVPAQKPRDIGFDRSMIAAYGHDDKACSFANLAALLETKSPKSTAIAYFSDKEEIGSYGDTGAESFILVDFAQILIRKLNLSVNPNELLRKAKAISADVSAGMNPNYQDVYEENNSAILGNGVVVEKYTGAGGKYSANDASGEYMNEIRQLLLKHKVKYQTGELGKIDIGGGGTIALYMSRYGMNTVDVGPAVLGMHSPREVMSKADLFETVKFYKAFFAE